jgi:two-component system LytT family response regulator
MTSIMNPLSPAPRALSVVIADDDALARARLRRLLSAESDVRIVCECDDARTAMKAIADHRPDLVFLDIHMPDLDGMKALDALPAEAFPNIVFVTAYDQYALDAFALDAVDYLLKPFDRERLRQALVSAARRRASGTDERGSLDAMRHVFARNGAPSATGGSPYIDRIAVRDGGRIRFIQTRDVDYFESAANYVRIHVASSVHQIREKISTLATRLDPERFARIHRSSIVNLDRVKEMQPAYSGDAILILTGGQRVRLSRGYRGAIDLPASGTG